MVVVFKGRTSSSAVRQKSKPADKPEKAGGKGLFRRRKAEELEPAISKADLDAGVSRALRMRKVEPASVEAELRDYAAARLGLQAIEGILYALDQAREILTHCDEIVRSALDTDDLGGRALLAEKYDEHRLRINTLGDGVNEATKPLICAEAEPMVVELTGRARYSIAAMTLDVSPAGLSLSPPVEAFAETDEIEATRAEIQHAHDRVERATVGYCRDAKFLMSCLKPTGSSNAA